jgi:hypothetical protein
MKKEVVEWTCALCFKGNGSINRSPPMDVAAAALLAVAKGIITRGTCLRLANSPDWTATSKAQLLEVASEHVSKGHLPTRHLPDSLVSVSILHHIISPSVFFPSLVGVWARQVLNDDGTFTLAVEGYNGSESYGTGEVRVRFVPVLVWWWGVFCICLEFSCADSN